jgi:primosomal protein N' (replication factor Y)
MLSKGLDFENVSVVGIISADSLLNYPDFRSHERGFQLMMQAAGRAGRSKKQGKVIIQSSDPTQPIYDYILNYNYEGFYIEQMDERKLFRYPPFTRLISIVFKDKNENKVDKGANLFANIIKPSLGNMVLGPNKPVVSRIQQYNIREILLKLDNNISASKIRDFLKQVEIQLRENIEFKYLHIYYDVDKM